MAVKSSIVTLFPRDSVFEFAAVRQYLQSQCIISLQETLLLSWVSSGRGAFLSLRDFTLFQPVCLVQECGLQPRLAALSPRLRLSPLFLCTVLLSASIQTKQLPLLLWALDCYGLWKKLGFFLGLWRVRLDAPRSHKRWWAIKRCFLIVIAPFHFHFNFSFFHKVQGRSSVSKVWIDWATLSEACIHSTVFFFPPDPTPNLSPSNKRMDYSLFPVTVVLLDTNVISPEKNRMPPAAAAALWEGECLVDPPHTPSPSHKPTI